MKQQRLLTRLVTSIFLLCAIPLIASLASAVGCCIEGLGGTSSHVASCLDDGKQSTYSYYAGDPNAGGSCLGTWYADACENYASACETICCCSNAEPGRFWETITSSCLGPDTPLPKTAASCSLVCAPQGEKYVLNGTVVDQEGNPVSNANVSLNVPSLKVVTGSDGTFSFTGVPSSDNSLSATNGTCSGSTVLYVRQDRADIIITLICKGSGTGDDTCSPTWNCYYNDNTQCGRRYDQCTDTSGCTTPPANYTDYYPTRDLPFNPCPATSMNCVNDGTVNVQDGEQCDNQNGNIRFAPGINTLCSDYSSYVNDDRVGCTNCRVDTTNCQRCPGPNPAYCTAEQCVLCPTDCGAMPGCRQYNCLEQTPQFSMQDVIYTAQRDTVTLTWQFTNACTSAVESFIIESCQGTNCGEAQVTRNIRLDPFSNNEVFATAPYYAYTGFEGLQQNTDYCYRVVANIKEQDMVATTASGFVCLKSGDDICMQPHPDQMCGETGTTIIECGINNRKNEVRKCESDLACFSSEETGHAICADQGACEYCNGLLGMYSYLALSPTTVFEVPFFDLSYAMYRNTSCNHISIFNPSTTPLSPGDTLPACFRGASPTIMNSFDSCEKVQTCYDYTNRDSCVNDHCHAFSSGSACKWNPFPQTFSEQTGLGVCVPTNDEGSKQQCARCNTDNHILPACTETLCHLYETIENGCLHTIPFGKTEGLCLSKAEATCTDYKSQDECEGPQNDRSTYNLLVTYDTTFYAKRPNGTTHEITSTSNDYFRFGKCQWQEEEQTCIKNADLWDDIDDCAGLQASYPGCNKDFEPPVTSLFLINPQDQPWGAQHPVYSAKELFLYGARDNYFTGEDLDTYFGYAQVPAGGQNSTYPTTKVDLFMAQLRQQPDGNYNITYYSKDRSENLEVVNYDIITFDNTPPINTSFGYIERWFKIGEDQYRTNLTITHAYTDPHGYLSCNTSLFSLQLKGLHGDRHFQSFQSGASLENFYYGLPDDDYQFVRTCSDHPFLNNTITYTSTIIVEADKSITNPQPKKQVFHIPNGDDTITILLNISTNRSVSECKYIDARISSTPLTHPGAQSFTINNDAKVHTAIAIYNQEGVYYYHVGCEFEDGNQTQGNLADTILFSIDNTPPVTTLIDVTTGKRYNDPGEVSFFTEELTLTFDVTDNNEALIIYGPDGETPYWDGNAGVDHTRYCRNDNSGSGTCNPMALWNGDHISYDEATIGTDKRLHFYSVDKAGNREMERYETLLVKNLDLFITGVTICTTKGVCYPLSPKDIIPTIGSK